MTKVTSKLQVTLPKAVAKQLGINPGDEIDWEIAGAELRLIPAGKRRQEKSSVQPAFVYLIKRRAGTKHAEA
jgi:AbrB family looped-hinge helix DNA binding protein